MKSVSFWKYHGIGNDFLVLDGIRENLPLKELTSPLIASRICDRHMGVGADGILFVLPPKSTEAIAWMRVINADGSEAEMCGNGIRCVAKSLHEHFPSFKELHSLPIDTGAGLLTCTLTLDTFGQAKSVRVDMGPPSFECAQIPVKGQGRFVDRSISVQGKNLISTAVSMGNPHLITFLSDHDNPKVYATTLGPLLEVHEDFPKRTNVEFARMQPDGSIELWVWERGCGITMACGTGACATAAAAVITNRKSTDTPIFVQLPGGTLTITVTKAMDRVWMEGPASEVFRGEIDLKNLCL